MAQALISRRGGGSGNIQKKFNKILSDITYSGRAKSMIKEMDGDLYALLILETSGTLTVSGTYTADIWLCGGGGQGGGTVVDGVGNYICGGGGGGGYTTNAFGITLASGSVSIGAGGAGGMAGNSGGTTSYLTYTAAGGSPGVNGGAGGDGGCGGGTAYDASAYGHGQGTTTKPFESDDMEPQCGGGASKEAYSTLYGKTSGGNGGTDGGDGTKEPGSGLSSVQGIGGFSGGRTNSYEGQFSNGNGYGGGGCGQCATSGVPAATTIGTLGGDGAMMIRVQL